MTKKTAKKKDDWIDEGLVPGGDDLEAERLEDCRDQDDDDQLELPEVPAPAVKVLVRSINNHRIHLGGKVTLEPGEAMEVTPGMASRLIARDMVELMQPEGE